MVNSVNPTSCKAEKNLGVDLVSLAAGWLEGLTRAQAAMLLTCATAFVCVADYSTVSFELCIATLYVIPIAIACWYYGSREALTLTVAMTLIAAAKYPLNHPEPLFWVGVFNALARAAAFLFIALVVSGARRVFSQMHELAHRDRTTGVLNRLAFDIALEQYFSLARTTNRSLLLTFIDIDGFKHVNDQFGHDAGDKVLREFADGALKVLRPSDRIGRLGGDEFATLSLIGPGEDAVQAAHTTHRHFSDILHMSGFAVTCSIGAVVIPPDAMPDRDALLRQADNLMYQAKRSGKNTVCTATAPMRPDDTASSAGVLAA